MEREGNIFARVLPLLASTSSSVRRSPPLNVPVALAQKRLNRGRVSPSFNACSILFPFVAFHRPREPTKAKTRTIFACTNLGPCLDHFVEFSSFRVCCFDHRSKAASNVWQWSIYATVWSAATVWPRRPCSTCCSSTLPCASDCDGPDMYGTPFMFD